MELKLYNRCQEYKSIAQFYNAGVKKYPKRLRPECKSCTYKRQRTHTRRETERNWYKENSEKVLNKKLMSKFGISLEDYNKILESQNGVCAICKQTDRLSRRLAVDHCHKTMKVRGLLCFNCNTGLGNFYDNSENLKTAIYYLEIHE